MRYLTIVISVLALASCAPPVPDDSTGVGFDGYQGYAADRAARDAELAGTIAPGAAISDEQVVTGPVELTESAMTMPDATSDSTATPRIATNPDNPTISDEQDFASVSGRRSIESDRERIAAQREAYKVIQPTALPTRSGGSGGPSIVEFALATSNQVGQSIYKRSSFSSRNRFDRNCAKYASSDLAQAAFLKSGGPKRDRSGLDPDGDGFACYWNPVPFRQAVRNQ
ncbi:MAG: hypothetical protein KUG58_01570 [Marinosulfonomonas sp.]|nr:hypothetical protein [Marinosulfonomonas sp.]